MQCKILKTCGSGFQPRKDRCAFEAAQALPSNMICGFKTRFSLFLKGLLMFVFGAVFFRRRRIEFSRFHPGNEKE